MSTPPTNKSPSSKLSQLLNYYINNELPLSQNNNLIDEKEEKEEDKYYYNNSHMCVTNKDFDVNLSECLSMQIKPNEESKIQLSGGLNLCPGVIGIYRRAIGRTSLTDFSLIEETRVITNITLYNRYLCFKLCPVIRIIENQVIYNNKVPIYLVWYDNTILSKSIWIRVIKSGIHALGCIFIPNVAPIRRTAVYDGVYYEKNGRIVNLSAKGYIPKRFESLFIELLLKDDIIW